ncbi:Aste57867_2052 [Aphanomyces stellatus]|uniref:Aste57867_2052 protein n=1 Tax=Aphanomyces stellatus TaxID=120398 RepID=A0A485K6S0_9STRA|nr:hypothetical protein As57867_002048 [Aphanomyces stellatus]VFT79256.1 Aste57867_2052 [Aphanomyces stellatus]
MRTTTNVLVSVIASLLLAVSADVPTLPLAKPWTKCEVNTTTFNESQHTRLNQDIHRHVPYGEPIPGLDQEDIRALIPLPDFAECAKFTAPLCYDGICDANQTIEIWAKRLPAINQSSQTKSLFIMDGGPGAASCDMEDLQQRTWVAFQGAFDVYIHDPRGTGRSEMLKCANDTNEALPSCLRHLNYLYGAENAGGFGLTSAATDLLAMAKSINPDIDWYLYGVSYGTLLAARTMHVGEDDFQFKGIIMDSVTPEVWSDDDIGFNDVALRYLAACEADAYCIGHMQQPLVTLVRQVYAVYDNTSDTKSSFPRCRQWIRDEMSLRPEETTSFGVKKLFAYFIRSQSKQQLFPPFLLRLLRCNDADWAIFSGAMTTYIDSDDLEDNILFPYDSRQLNQLIDFSELTNPQDYQSLIDEFKADLITLPEYDDMIPYCYYHNSDADECDVFNITETLPFVYERDDYYGKFATIPDDTSVLIMSGYYDTITPDGWAQSQFNGMTGDAKIWFNFNHTDHSVVDTPCGFHIFKEFLHHDGNVKRINATCLGLIPKLKFKVNAKLSNEVFGVPDIYAGIH